MAVPAVNRLTQWAALLVMPVALACSPTSGPATGSSAPVPSNPVRGGTITDSQVSDANSMQPITAVDTGSSAFIGLHYNAPLIRYDPNELRIDTKYGTAQSYQIAPDGLSITFKLKDNIFWSDGVPITAQDYAFTFEKKVFDPTTEYAARANFKQFKTVNAPDDKTLIFTMSEVFCPALNQLTFEPVPKHIFEGLNINDNPINLKPVVGSGPWLLKEWVRDQYAVFEANDKYYLGRPNVDKYVIRIVKDQTIQYTMLKNGEIDIATVRAEDWEEAQSLKNLKTYNYYPASSSWTFIGFNMQNEILSDLRVRQALSMAMDRQKMVDGIRQGHAKPLDTIYTSATWAHSTDVTKYGYDVSKAKQLLEDAGWKAPANNPTGTRVKDNKPLKMRIFYNSGNKEREQIATVAQQYAKAIGVELEIQQEDFNAYLNRIQKTKDVELFVLGWSSPFEPHTAISIWSSTGGQNVTGFSNPRVDTLYPQGSSVASCTPEDRKPIYAEIQKLVTADAPYIFLWENESLVAASERLELNPLSKQGVGYRPWEWFSKTGK